MRLRLAVILAVLALSACKPKPSSTVVIDPGLLTLVGSDAIYMGGIRVEQLKPTPLWQRFVVEQKNATVDEFSRKTGIDPRQKIWQILLTGNGKDNWAMVRGDFATELGKEPEVHIEGAERTAYKGYTLIGTEDTSLVFMNPGIAVVASVPALKRLIDSRNSPSGGPPKWLLDRAAAIPSTNQIWFVGSVSGVTQRFAPPKSSASNFTQFLDRTQLLTAEIDVSQGLKIHLEGECTDEKGARQIHDALRALIGMLRINTATEATDLLRAYDSVKVTWEQKKVTVDSDMKMPQVDALLNLARIK